MATVFVHLLFLVISLLGRTKGDRAIYEGIVRPPPDFTYPLPNLPYEYSDLEPHIDEKTVRVHHLGHHKAYTEKMNAALKEWRKDPSIIDKEVATSSIVDILTDINTVPKKWRTAIRNNGGGYVNHIIYWATMARPRTAPVPSTIMMTMIEESFGSFEYFKGNFTEQSLKLFGSGYVWLCLIGNSTSLTIKTTPNQDSPISKGLYPILVIDIWEHAYYLKYQVKRASYIDGWWELVSWKEVERLMEFWLTQDSFSLKQPTHRRDEL